MNLWVHNSEILRTLHSLYFQTIFKYSNQATNWYKSRYDLIFYVIITRCLQVLSHLILVYMRQWIGSALVHIIDYSAPKNYLNQLWNIVNWTKGTEFCEILNKIQNFQSRKCFWKYRLRNGGHFVQGRWVKSSAYEAFVKLCHWAGPRFTNGFSIAIQIRWKFRSTLTSILIQWSL